MQRLIEWSVQRVRAVSVQFKRYLSYNVDWSNRLILITGSRGVGKTTLVLQYIKTYYGITDEVLYVSANDLYFSVNTVVDLTEEFVKRGGKHLFIDEIQKYPNWSNEIKIIYDQYPDLKITITGSSTLELIKGDGDLSRRMVRYHMNGMSFREYIEFMHGEKFKVLTLTDVVESSMSISSDISSRIKPIKWFEEYLKIGYYPFVKENSKSYHSRILQVLDVVMEVDIPLAFKVDFSAVLNIKKLLKIIANSVPFKPNINKLSQQVGLSRETLVKYLQFMEKADMISLLYSSTKGVSLLNKPEKIYLQNPNIIYAIGDNVNVGNLRETFFFNQLSALHHLSFSGNGDFFVDDSYVFEVGGKNKKLKQVQGVENSFVAADNIEIGGQRIIPLWLFGFLY
jgi:predicted AAA+ superfamily ATPase